MSDRTRSKGTIMPSIVAAGLQVTGNMNSEGDIQIEGTIEGDVNSRSVTIGLEGAVKGQVNAEEVHVSGGVEGKIKAKSVMLAASAKVIGDIIHDTLAIEAGAYVEGALKRYSKPEAVASGGSSERSGSGERPELKEVKGGKEEPLTAVEGGRAGGSKA